MTDKYALFGNPIKHSKSPMIHGVFAEKAGQDMSYGLIEAARNDFAQAVHGFRAEGGRGGNVTMPFKQEAFALATDLTSRARLAGAVNALKFEGDRIYADNFDGIGLVNDIQRNLGFALKGRRVLLMGAGGAACGAMSPILEQQPSRLVLANRTVDKATHLMDAFKNMGNLVGEGYADLGQDQFDIVINATSASMQGESLPITPAVFAPGCLAYDLVYGKGLTPFLAQARQNGAGKIADGVGMLVEQAAEAFLWWRGIRPETGGMIATLTVPLV